MPEQGASKPEALVDVPGEFATAPPTHVRRLVLASANHKRWETQMSATTFLQRATDSVTFAGGGKRWVFPQCREGADHD